ncbi:MAG: hypothetical protein M1831_006164 [Alyxoria varia]|nr:MAG: hypothetical protein M1831_006164 [Alyxoria varia]
MMSSREYQHSGESLKDQNGAGPQAEWGFSIANNNGKGETLTPDEDEVKEDAHPREGMKAYVWVLILISILSSHFLYALDNTVVADIQPSIIADLGEIEKLPWITVAFAFATASVTLVWGKFYGLLNAKHTFLSAVFLFEVGTAVCGSAPSMNALIVGRALCGIGAGGIYTGTMNMITALTTVKERPAYLGLTGLTWGTGTVLGPVIGGAFAESKATWRWGFYIGLCVVAVAAPVYVFLLPAYDLKAGTPARERAKMIDWLGMILMVGAFVSGVMAISFGGAIYAWNNGRIIGPLCCCGALWIAFGFQQTFCFLTTKVDRLFPVQMLGDWEMVILFIESASSVTCVFLPIYFIPLYFQFVRDDAPVEAAVRLLPFIFTFVFATMLNGVMMTKTGYYMPWYLAGGALILVGGVLMYGVDQYTKPGSIYGYSILISIGAGSFNQASWAVAQAKTDKTLFPLASAFIGIANIGGLTIALTVSNSIFVNKATSRIGATLPNVSTGTIQAAIAGIGSDLFQDLTEDQRTSTLKAITDSISDVYILAIVSGIVCVVFAVFMKREKLFVD